MTITLQQIRDKRPCASGWEKLLISIGQNHAAPDLTIRVSIGDVLLSNGLADAHWCLRCLPPRDAVKAVWPSVLRVQPEPLPQYVLDLQRWVDGDDSVDLAAVRLAAWDAAEFASAQAAWAAGARAAAEAVAWATARAGAAWAARAAARAADNHEAERERQRQDLLAMFPPTGIVKERKE